MRKVTVKEWSDALRSGEYTQGKTFLQDEDGKNCCLGVLCRLADMEFDPELLGGVFKWRGIMFNNAGVGEVLDELIEDYSNLPSRSDYDFSEPNDMGATFNEIADYLDGKISVDYWFSRWGL
jgi:hypothetical protein